jgi:hypothetical protein
MLRAMAAGRSCPQADLTQLNRKVGMGVKNGDAGACENHDFCTAGQPLSTLSGRQPFLAKLAAVLLGRKPNFQRCRLQANYFDILLEFVRWPAYYEDDGSRSWDQKGTRCGRQANAVTAPATVGGEPSAIEATGQLGRRREGKDPQVRRPAIAVVNRGHIGRGEPMRSRRRVVCVSYAPSLLCSRDRYALGGYGCGAAERNVGAAWQLV